MEGLIMDWLIEIGWWIRLFVEIGIFAGVAWLVYINKYHYNQRLKAKDDQIALLERTQIENVMAKLEAMKNYIKELEEQYERKINEIEAAKQDKDKLIAELRAMIENIEARAETTTMAASGYGGYGLGALLRPPSDTKDKK